MFTGKSIWEILSMGGFTMYVLLFCSVLSVAVIIERLVSYGALARVKRAPFMLRIREAVMRNAIDEAREICKLSTAPFAEVALAGLEHAGSGEKLISAAMERQISLEEGKLARLTGVVGTIGNIAVYIGLFGTVLGIIRAFRDISTAGGGGMDVVIGGVAEALITTATGLAVAVPAVIFYNYFTRRIDGFVSDMELCSSELTDLIGK